MIQPIDEDAVRRDLAENPPAVSPLPVQVAASDYDLTSTQVNVGFQGSLPAMSEDEIDRIKRSDKIEKKIANRWSRESTLINIFAVLIVLLAGLGAYPLIVSEAYFYAALLYGFPAIVGLQLLRRSDMSRRVIVVILYLNIAFQVLPYVKFLSFNIISIVLSLIIIGFLNSNAIKRHF